MGILAEVKGQDLCQAGGGGFSVNGTTGTGPVYICSVNTSIVVTSTATNANNIGYNFDYKGESNPATTANTTHTYQKPGRYRILQVGSRNATGITACREVIVLTNTPPNVQIQPCPGNIVKLTIVRDSLSRPYDQFEISWNDGSRLLLNQSDSLTVTHSYAITGTYAIAVRGIYLNAGGCAGSTTIRPTVTLIRNQLALAVSEVQARADGSATLTYTGTAGVEAEVLAKTGTGIYIPLGVKNAQGGTQTLTLSSLNPRQVYCIKLRAVDACGNTVESNAMCTMLLNGTAESERNVLTWNQPDETQGFVRYQLLRDGAVVKSTTNVQDASYVDTDVQCGVTYRYQVIATSDRGRSVSAPIEVTARSDRKPGVITDAIVSVENNGSVSVVAFPPAQGSSLTYKMVFERADSPTGEFQEIGTVDNLNRYSDITVNSSERSYCYRVSYENACGTRSDPSEAVCTIFLQRSGNLIRWTNDMPFTDNVGSYFVIKLNQGGASSETGVGLNVSYDPKLDDPTEQQFDYQIRGRSQNGNFLSFSNILVYRREASLFLPDAFTPNGDGLNDVFELKGTFVDNYQMIIYNRWGQSIFQTATAGQGWDGTVGGERAPEGSYGYKVIISDDTGREFVKAGTFLLLR